MSLKRTKPLRRVSVKQAAALRIYYKKRKQFLEDRPWCEAAAIIWPAQYRNAYLPNSVEVHHRSGRGAHLNDTDSWIAVSREAHEWIHKHPSRARQLGLLT